MALRVSHLVIVLLLISTLVPSTATAVNNTTTQQTPVDEPNTEGGPVEVEIGERVQGALTSFLMDLVGGIVERLNQLLVRIFVSYPDVTHERVLEIHQRTFQVSLVLSTAATVWIGILYMLNRIDGVRPLIYLLGAVAFGAVAPDLLSYPVEASRLTTVALAPQNAKLVEVSRFTVELLLVLVLDAFLLLGTVMIFVARDVYLMLGVALAPLIALMAATPPLRRFADRLISIWVACLLIGPINATTLDLTFSLMGSSFSDTPHYLWGLGGIALLFGLPVILLSAGAVVFAPMTRIATRGTGMAKGSVRAAWGTTRNRRDDDQRSEPGVDDSRSDGGNRFRRQNGGDNR